jgi:glycine/serine hydroxymethyltransferase
MGHREMREIAFQIHRVLTHRDDESVIAETREAVANLCSKFAPYPA